MSAPERTSGIAHRSHAPDLAACRATVDDGLLMVFGPDGDPLPPEIFAEAAQAQPEASIDLAGEPVPAIRAAAVLEAQRSGRLAPAEGGEAWLRSMLGSGPAPEAAIEAELEADDRVELMRFGREIVLTTPAGGVLLLHAAEGGDESGIVCTDAAGVPLGHNDFLELVAADPSGDAQARTATARTQGASVVMDVASTTVCMAAAGPEDEPLLSACAETGEAIDWPAFVRTVTGLPEGMAEVASEGLPDHGPPKPVAAASTPAGVPGHLAFDRDGFADLAWLEGALDGAGYRDHAIIFGDLPHCVRPSAGRATDRGWRVEPDEVGALALFAIPDGLQDFLLEIAIEGVEPAPWYRVEITPPFATAREVTPVPVEVALELPPPFSPRNRLDYFAVVMIHGLPEAARLSAGTPLDASWVLAPEDLRDLRVELPAGAQLPCTMEVVGIAIEDRDGQFARATRKVTVGADARSWAEGSFALATLDLGPLLEAVGPDRRIDAVAISGLSPAVELSKGSLDRVSQCWVLRACELEDLTLTVRDPGIRRLSLKAKAIAIDGRGGASAITQTFTVEVPHDTAGGLAPVDTGPGFFRSRSR